MALALWASGSTHAQQAPQAWGAVTPELRRPQEQSDGGGPPTWIHPIASLIVPGTGQLMAGQDRGAIYLATEGLLLIRFFGFQSEGNRQSEQYRNLAFTVARAPFSPLIRDTAFSYFEDMAAYVESGPFDTDEGPGFSPPVDSVSYNGLQWLLARRTFFANPDSAPDIDSEEYQRALSFYRARAVGPNFQWSWRNAGLEQDLYRRTINDSDEGYRQATTHLGLLLANHLISAVDAFISSRLSRNGRQVQVSTAVIPKRGRGLQLLTTVSVGF